MTFVLGQRVYWREDEDDYYTAILCGRVLSETADELAVAQSPSGVTYWLRKDEVRNLPGEFDHLLSIFS